MSDPKTNLSSMSKEDPSSTAGVMVQQVLPFALLRGKAMVEKPQDLFRPMRLKLF